VAGEAMSQYDPMNAAYGEVFAQYAELAAFLWEQRRIAVKRPDYVREDIANLESRLALQLDGLMTSIDAGWSACEAGLDIGEAGEVFTAACAALRSRAVSRIQRAVEAGLVNPLATPGLVSALGWLPSEVVDPWIERFLAGKDMRHKYLGVAACSVRRRDPGDMLTAVLQRPDCLQHEELHARALRLIGELRRQDLMAAVVASENAQSECVKFWGLWAAIMLGNKRAVEKMKAFVFKPGPYQVRAIELAFRVLPVEYARGWISEMASDKALARSVVVATGVLGDPHAVNWLIAKMAEPDLARVAGEAFSLITGADLKRLQATQPTPEGWQDGPNDDPADDVVALDEDEYLPWPDKLKVAALWQRHGHNFMVGQRYFMGRPVSADNLKDGLMNGHQHQRHAAALELALLGEQSRFANTRARVSL